MIWDTTSGTRVNTLSGSKVSVRTVAFSANGLLASGEDSTINIWYMYGTVMLKSLKNHTGVVESVAFNADNVLVSSSSNYESASDYTIKVWTAD